MQTFVIVTAKQISADSIEQAETLAKGPWKAHGTILPTSDLGDIRQRLEQMKVAIAAEATATAVGAQ